MTVTSQTAKVTTTGNGSATSFSFSPIVIFASSDLEVVTTLLSTGVETSRSEGTGDSKWSLGITTFPATGSIIYPADAITALTNTHSITIKRVLTLEQQTDLNNQGGYFPDVQEDQFDKLLMIDIQQQEDIDRSLKLPSSYTGSIGAAVPAPLVALQILRINTAKDALEWASFATVDGDMSDVTPLAATIAGGSGIAADASREDHVHPQTFIKGGDITSASPLVIDTDGRYFDVSGTTNFAAMTVATNRFFVLQFDGILTMTHHATNLNLPGEANITTAAGDRAICISTGTNQVIVVSYILASGRPLTVGGKQAIWVPAAAMRPTVSNGCASLIDVETTAGRPDLTVLDFDASADEHAQFQVAFGNSWNLGTISFRGFWTVSAAVTTGIALALQALAITDNVTIDQVYSDGTPIVVTDDAQGATEELLVTAESAALTIANTPIDGDLNFFRCFRDVSDGNDDMTQDMRLFGLQVFITTDTGVD